MVNESESLLNTVKLDEPKATCSIGLCQKARDRLFPLLGGGTLTFVSPVKRRDLPNSVTCAERGKPVRAFFKNEATHNTLASRETGRDRYRLRVLEQGAPQGSLYLCR